MPWYILESKYLYLLLIMEGRLVKPEICRLMMMDTQAEI